MNSAAGVATLGETWSRVVALFRHPIVQTFLFLGIVGLAVLLLGQGEGSSDLADSTEWLVWKVTAAVGQALALTLFLHGVVQLVSLWDGGNKRYFWTSVITAAVFAIGLFFAIHGLLHAERNWEIANMQTRLRWVVGVGTLCASPWVAVVWIAYERLRGATTSKALVVVWQVIVNAAQAFALFVVVALLPTGALLQLWLAQESKTRSLESLEATFDASDVALYGAMYGVISIAIILPLVAAWRRSAREYVDRRFEIQEDLPENWHDDRAKLEKLLGLDVTLIRNPLTLLTILTPLLTSIVATYLPSVADK